MNTHDNLLISIIGWILFTQCDAVREYEDDKNNSNDLEKIFYARGYIDNLKQVIDTLNKCLDDEELEKQSRESARQWFLDQHNNSKDSYEEDEDDN